MAWSPPSPHTREGGEAVYETITFLTDFGLEDDFVGVCRGVMRSIARDAEILDLTHGIRPQAVTQGALVLARAIPYLPPAVHLAVVDPGVGSERRAVAIRTGGGRAFVGPDNGLLTLAADEQGIEAVRGLTNPRYHLASVSKTFHARDVFSPAAAHLAAGAHFDDLGEEIDPESLVRTDLHPARIDGSTLTATIVDIDRFGNLQLNVSRAEIDVLELARGGRVELRFELSSYFALLGETYADAPLGELILYEDSYGSYEIAIHGGKAAALTEATPGDTVRICPA
jgi:hypothetical protein